MSSTKVSLKCFRNDFLHRPDTEKGVTTWEVGVGNEWTLESTEKENVYKLKSWKGDYLHRPDTSKGVTTWGEGIGNEWTLEVSEEVAEGKMVRLKSWKGDYLCRSANDFGVTTTDVLNKTSMWMLIQEDANIFKAPAKDMKISLQADTEKWVARCRNCASGTEDIVTIHLDTCDEPYAQFTVEALENGKIALKADTGKYLGRCRNCVDGVGGLEDIVAVHLDTCDEPYAQFTPVLLENGKYAFKADTDKWLSRCLNCISDASYNEALTIHLTENNEPYSQFTVLVH